MSKRTRISQKRKKYLHDKCLDDLVNRLAPKPGFLCPNAEYRVETDDGYVVGECDVRKITRNSSGEKFQRYYEVKWRHSSYLHNKAMKQFKRHASVHEGNWKYIYVTPERFIKYTRKDL